MSACFFAGWQIVNYLKKTHERLSNRVFEMVAARYHVAKFGRSTSLKWQH
jgi:hypothetical protein